MPSLPKPPPRARSLVIIRNEAGAPISAVLDWKTFLRTADDEILAQLEDDDLAGIGEARAETPEGREILSIEEAMRWFDELDQEPEK